MNSKRKLGLLLVLMTAPALALAQDSGGHGGESGGGCGDVFGDLVHILRHPATGQPILQKRDVLLPMDVPGVAYCPIAVTESGEEIPFVDLSCDLDEAYADEVVEVDYFGRLSGGRTKERNSRMHFDEVISSIKDDAVGWVGQDETGRMRLGYDCTTDLLGVMTCEEFRVIDSPMENLALYTRLMKYGHLQTNPAEVDTWVHGDPAAGVQYHPALAAADYAKFDEDMKHLLPGDEEDPTPELTCFGGAEFAAGCANGETYRSKDLTRAAKFLAGAANKTGKITVDLVQYMNRILKITQTTAMSTTAVDTLPALIRDCGADNALSSPASNGNCADPVEAGPGLPAPANERFVDYDPVKYSRGSYHNRGLEALQDQGSGTWTEVHNLPLMVWLEFVDKDRGNKQVQDLDGFVLAASDGLRSIEFVHNYAIPEDLWKSYAMP